MAAKSAQDSNWIQVLDNRINSEFNKKTAATVREFARRYFASTAKSELAKLTDDEIFESAEDGWKFLQQRKVASPKISFVHRELSKDQQRQTGTSIYILLDDMPFVVDSVRLCLNREGVIVRNVNNAVLHVSRGDSKSKGKGRSTGKFLELHKQGSESSNAEALSCIDCAHIPDDQLENIEQALRLTLEHVATAVKDHIPMCKRAEAIRKTLMQASDLPVNDTDKSEALAFIDWLLDNHFTFLGYEAYKIRNQKGDKVLELQDDSLLGVSTLKADIKKRVRLKDLPKGTANLILKKQLCNFAKSSNLSRVHRPAYYDYVLLKEFDSDGNVVVEHRFLGLYTSSVYFQSVQDIPIVRLKVKSVLEESGFAPNGHSIKDLLQVINVFPRDELFQITPAQLLETAVEITQIRETQICKLFMRKDSYGKFYSCLIYVPRDVFNTKVREDIQEFLEEQLRAKESEYDIYMSESTLVRLHLTIRVHEIEKLKLQVSELEEQLVELVKPWHEYFLDALLCEFHDKEADELYETYTEIYPESYKETYSGKEGVEDIACIEEVVSSRKLGLDLCVCGASEQPTLRFKIFNYENQLHLSDVAPILENLGLSIISEKAFSLSLPDGHRVWLHDFSVFSEQLEDELDAELKEMFEDAFQAIWEKRVDDDQFNALVITAGINWRDVALLRAYAAYLKQIKFGYGAPFVASTLAKHGQISRALVDYFYCLLDPEYSARKRKQAATLEKSLVAEIDKVSNLSEDSVLRAYLNLMNATQRSNYFQQDEDGEAKNYFSFKFLPEQITNMPLPKPKYEIFVYARSIEGVHLRGGKVARGGLRWSDRHEDYRTEVLGLVKAQQVKNSVIVPVGAKGGFVVKGQSADREEAQKQGVACYKTFISGLLDITDNLVKGKLEPPKDVVRRDDDDPYLVVAADKGTATFSDTANGIAQEYNFWLGDGFASGGSNGYDHKQMGITARGAWVSVQRHFRELGINVQKEDFSVVGIGDMSGDVFGNGMLLSRHICLKAAFNHLHIFIDPQPDAAASFKERQRLFRKPRSGWADYNSDLISSGGGVFERSQKSISITRAMQQAFDIEEDKLTPDELINRLLKSPVDLIWNGGIGTYVKASSESHADVGDKTNDSLRLDANELRCKVIGEGGNLGLTQKARIEFGLNGGISITDFVDNSAGVDCSDHEVNIKILLNELLNKGDLSESRRNKLLESMTDDVAALVLDNNYSQVQSIGLAWSQAELRHREFSDLTDFLEAQAGLNRKLEYLPSKEGFEERGAKAEYLTRPEIAVLTSYMKMHLKDSLADADYLQQDYFNRYLHQAFPEKLVKSYAEQMLGHQLRSRIVSTQLANQIVNVLGPSFVYRMVDSTASTVAEVVRAAVIVMDCFAIDKPWTAIEALDYRIPADVQAEMMSRLVRLVRRVTRWLLRNRRGQLDSEQAVSEFMQPVARFKGMLPDKLPAEFAQMFDDKMTSLKQHNVPEKLAKEICQADFLFPAISLVEVSKETDESLAKVVDIYYSLGEELQLNWLGRMINQLPVSSYWQALARETYLDDLSWQQRALTCNVVKFSRSKSSTGSKINHWVDEHAGKIDRSNKMMHSLQAEPNPDYSMFSVALRELLTLAQSTRN
ncbi:MAG: NAD-glutamate dehydrogenase [Gammaproteobacteria bacterium]